MSSAWKRTGIILGVLALIIVVVALLAPKLLDLNRYHGLIVEGRKNAIRTIVSAIMRCRTPY
jgi:hypothetical protein